MSQQRQNNEIPTVLAWAPSEIYHCSKNPNIDTEEDFKRIVVGKFIIFIGQ